MKDQDYLSKPEKEWDGKTPLVIFGTDDYYFDKDMILDHCKVNNLELEDLQMMICDPNYLGELDHSDFFQDELPEDQCLEEVAPDVVRAFKALNKIIEAQGPVSWTQGTYRATLTKEHFKEYFNSQPKE